MFRDIGIYFLFFLLSVSANKCIDKSPNLEKRLCQAVQISCPEGQVIYSPNVTASDQPCSSKAESCVNTTIHLMVGAFECYWQPSCVINFPTTPLLNCGKEVESLHINNWYCLDNNVQPQSYDGYICDNKTHFGADIDHGVIRSHADFPWKYDKHTFKGSMSKDLHGDITLQCTKTINLRLSSTERFLVSVQSYDIDKDNDNFSINGETPQYGYNKIFSSADKRIRFSFDVNPVSTKGGSGFVLCFKKLKIGERTDGMSACDEVMTITDKPVKKIRSPTNPYCQKAYGVSNRTPPKKDGIDESCDYIKTLYHTTGEQKETTSQPRPANASASAFCAKCLSKRKVRPKCKRKCCKGQTLNPKCVSNAQDTETKVQGKCTVPKRKVNRLCRKCESKTKCRKNFVKRCKDCCSDRKNNLAKCRKRKRKQRKRKKNKRKRTGRVRTRKPKN